MSRKSAIWVVSCTFPSLAVCVAAAQSPGVSGVKISPTHSAAKNSAGICHLLTSKDVEAVQGEPVKETKSTVQPSGGMRMSQCLFQTTSAAKSVIVTSFAIDPVGSSAIGPRQFWQNQFHSKRERELQIPASSSAPETGKQESEKDEGDPRPVEGLGEKAFWVGSRVSGALYVLRGDHVLRISVGGIPLESARIDGSIQLARAVMKRL